MLKSILVLTTAALATAAVVPRKALQLPSYFETCQRDQPNVDDCILASLRNLRPYLTKGVEELNLPPLDPYYMDEHLFGYNNVHIQGKSILKDVYTRGLKNVEFLAVRSNFDDLNNFHLDIDIFLPEVEIEGQYKLQGMFLTTDFGGRGDMKLSMKNVTATWALSGAQQVIDGVTYMKIKHFDMEPVVGDMNLAFSNLFNGNESLSKSIVKMFNQYWRVVYRELLPFAKEGWGKIMREIANRVFLKVPFNDIFPVSEQ